MTGHIYILINASVPGMLKIGMTTRTPEDRARELSQGTGIPAPYMVAYSETVADCETAEKMIHSRLAQFRVQQGREFFNLPLRDAIRELARIATEQRQQAKDLPEMDDPLPVVPARAPGASKKAIVAALAVLRKRFKGVKNIYLHPGIPPQKRTKLAARYSDLLHHGEEILLVYDGSPPGIQTAARLAKTDTERLQLDSTATIGFILTDRGVAWADCIAPPNYCTYQEFKPDEICNGWTGFYMQGNTRAEVRSEDRDGIIIALRQTVNDLW